MLFRFREFRINKESLMYRKEIYNLTKTYRKYELYVLTSQLRRAANSIVLNIAEGSNRSSYLDFKRFLNLAFTSLEEVVACLDISIKEDYLSKEKYNQLLSKAEILGKQILSFINKLSK